MSSDNQINQKTESKFYLVTTDILQGIGLILMVIGHAGHWWDHELARSWPHLEILSTSIIWWGFLVFPMFLFVYGFNTTHSLLRRKGDEQQAGIRRKAADEFLCPLLCAFKDALCPHAH